MGVSWRREDEFYGDTGGYDPLSEGEAAWLAYVPKDTSQMLRLGVPSDIVSGIELMNQFKRDGWSYSDVVDFAERNWQLKGIFAACLGVALFGGVAAVVVAPAVGSVLGGFGLSGFLGVAGASGASMPLWLAPLIFGASFALTSVFTDALNGLIDLFSGRDEVDAERDVFEDLKSKAMNRSFMSGLTAVERHAIWNAYVEGCEVFGFPVYPYPYDDLDGDIADAELKMYGDKLDIEYAKREEMSVAEFERELAMYAIKSRGEEAERELNLALKRKQLAEPSLSPYDITLQQAQARDDAALASAERLAAYNWDGLDDSVKDNFAARGIDRSLYESYIKMRNSGVTQEQLDLLFPAFAAMVTPDELLSDASYETVMTWLMDQDNTIEPESYQDVFESDITDKNSISLKEFYGFVSGRKAIGKRKRYIKGSNWNR